MVTRYWIVLPGGGVKGSWQIGFLRGHLKPNTVIDRVYGTSVGAIIAPLVAANRVDALEEMVTSLKSIKDVFKPWNPIENLLKIIPIYRHLGAYKSVRLIDRVNAYLDLMTPKEREDIYKKCYVVAWDIKNKRETWFNDDRVPFGVRASSALCIAVPPVRDSETDGIYTDGGVTDLIPITRVKQDLEAMSAKEKEDIVVLIVDSDTRVTRPMTTVPKDPITFAVELISDASSNLALAELTDWFEEAGVRYVYIKPSKDFFDSGIDIDNAKICAAVADGKECGENTHIC